MRNVSTATDRLLGGSTTEGGVGAKMLLGTSADARPAQHQRVGYGFELSDIMMIGCGHDDRQRDATGVDQQHSLAPLFFPDPSASARRTREDRKSTRLNSSHT